MKHDLFISLDAERKHRLATIATLRANADNAVASHISAAVLHGLDLWDTSLERVHMTVLNGHRRTTPRMHVHTTALSDKFVTTSEGLRMTTIDRTVIDCSRIMDLDHAVVIGDSALRSKKVSMDQLRAAVQSSTRAAGIGAARRAISSMNGLSESPGESLSRLRMAEFGFPDPILQQVLEVQGRFLARVDFYWKRWKLVGEFDGLGKYASGESNVKEKMREDDMRDRGLEVIRWTWKDLWNFGSVRAKFDRACQRVERRR
ncbi:hypothetical protein QMK17_00830 [Rhodococcus sp. G-MC3]|uniref:hypothetical protein n=1 Tax=Rhodococcus sp. G-MC3 TaxID=3046209 RepID=UPI0024BB0421|nr:hypothetical protein [Rhodococcus sp. G-MC3]MDJ0391874.1 hypothetical protein [Rhodococcus sp. G-MC3]